MELLRRCPRKEGMWDSPSTIRLIESFWELERQRATVMGQREDQPVPMSAVVDLILNDGMRWEWRIKDGASSSSRGDSELRELCMAGGGGGDGLYGLDGWGGGNLGGEGPLLKEVRLADCEFGVGFTEGLRSAWT